MYQYQHISQRALPRPAAHIDAVIWHSRRIPNSHGKHITGLHSPGPGKALIAHESLTEKGVIADIVCLAEVRLVLSQPFTVHYRVAGRRRRYTPDLLIVAQPVPRALVRHGFAFLTVVEVKAEWDPLTRFLYRLEVCAVATGMPVVLVRPVATEVGHAL